MARPRQPIGTYGSVNVAQVEPGKWRARTRYRFKDGTLRQVERFGPSAAKSRTALVNALLSIEDTRGGSLTPAVSLAELADRFMADREQVGRSPGTLETYQYAVDVAIKPRIGELTVRESTPELLQAFLSRLNKERGPGAAKNSRSVLSGMFGLAVRNGAAERNPVRELERITHNAVKGSPAFPTEELSAIVAAIRQDEWFIERDIADLFEFLSGTGWRISEACGLTFPAVDFVKGEVEMVAIAVRVKGKGVLLQRYGKSSAATRRNRVPAPILAMLERRRQTVQGTAEDLVFPSLLGNIRDPSNSEREWRARRSALGYPEATSHSFRKTVATVLDQAGMSAREIADYLGHKNPSMTQDVYMARNLGSARAAGVLDGILPSSESAG